MVEVPDNVRQDIVKLVPAALVSDISSFVFYDKHPRANTNLDIIICTSRGELKEFYQRELVYSALLDIRQKPKHVRILRNSKCDIFYLVDAGEEIIILSRKESLTVLHKFTNVARYDVEDSVCRGQVFLKIVRQDDAVPMVFDENLESLGERAMLLNSMASKDALPVFTNVKTKLSEARYNVICNEAAYRNLVDLRQFMAFSTYQKLSPISEGDLFGKSDDITCALKLKKANPWVKHCNQNILIVLEVTNSSEVPIENCHILLHGTARSVLSYKTKIFESIPNSPYWRENLSQTIKGYSETVMVAVIAVKELKYSVISKIEFNAVVCYKFKGKEELLPIENVFISSLNTLGEDFDVLSNNQALTEEVTRKIVLSVLATSEKTNLHLRHIKKSNEVDINIFNVFCEHLQMERIDSNIAIHRRSPYHILYGILVVQQESPNGGVMVSLYRRSPSQILAFLNYMYDVIPYRVITTTTKQKITAKTSELSVFSENITTAAQCFNITEYGTSVLEQTSSILVYFDKCMIKMHESKNPAIQNKVGIEINLLACGPEGYEEFRDMILKLSCS